MVWTEDKRKEENPDNKCFCRIFIRLRNKKISESDFCFIENFVFEKGKTEFMKNLDSMEQIMMEPAMEEYKETQRKLQEEGDPLASLEGIPYESSADDIRREKLLNEAALAILALLLLGMIVVAAVRLRKKKTK